MSNNIKKYKILLVIVFIGILVFSIVVYSNSKDPNSNIDQNNSESELLEDNQLITAENIVYETPSLYKPIREIVNFEDLETGIKVGSQAKPSSESIQFSESDDYVMQYNEYTNSILISILNSPFDKYKQEAEDSLLKALHITKEQACQINVEITTPQFVNYNEAGRVYRLRFCK